MVFGKAKIYGNFTMRLQHPIAGIKSYFYLQKNKILLFSSPFDNTAVDLLESLNCPIYKVASFELTDFPLIKKISQTKKPIIISTGTSTLKEIEKTFYYAKKNGAKDISLLYCVSNYPAKSSDFNLNNINILKKFNCKVGFQITQLIMKLLLVLH